MSLLPDDAGMELLHTRDYEIKVYRSSDEELLVRGAVSDRKPPGLYVVDDPDELEIHQMQLELRVAPGSLEIRSAKVLFETHPHATCPIVAADYEKLIGLSIARGFARKIRDLFGGPNGCTHTNALLQAMAPAVVQSTWSIFVARQREEARPHTSITPEQREHRIRNNLGTCHVWAEGGEHVRSLRSGRPSQHPVIPVRDRLRELGRSDTEWP